MTPPVKVLVDSTAGISVDLAQKWKIGVVPLYLMWDGQTFRDGLDLLPTTFYTRLAESKSIPKTAAPNPTDWITACHSALAAGHRQILIVTVTPTMSATYANACLAAREFDSRTVEVLDSGQGAGAQALVAAYAARLARQGARLPEVLVGTQAACQSTEVFVAVGTLHYLRRSGRISLARELLGEMIQMKPILTFVDHRLQVIARPRTARQANQWLLDRLTNGMKRAEQVLVMFADRSDIAAQFADHIRKRLPEIEIDISPASAVVGGNTGPGLLGLAVRWSSDTVSSTPG